MILIINFPYNQFQKLHMEENIRAMRKWLQERDIQADDKIVYAIHRFSVLYAEKLIRECIKDKVMYCKLKGEKFSKVNPHDIAMTYERMKGIQGGHLSRMNEQRKKKLIKMVNSQDLQIDKKNQTFLYMSNEIPHMMTKPQFQLGFDDSGKQMKMSKKKTIVIELPQEQKEQKKIQDGKSSSSNSLNKSKSQNQERKLDDSKQKKTKNVSQEQVNNLNSSSSSSKNPQYNQKSDQINQDNSRSSSQSSQNNSFFKKLNQNVQTEKNYQVQQVHQDQQKQEKKWKGRDFQIEEKDQEDQFQWSDSTFFSFEQSLNNNSLDFTQKNQKKDNHEVIVISSSQNSESVESIVIEDKKQVPTTTYHKNSHESGKQIQLKFDGINYFQKSQRCRNLFKNQKLLEIFKKQLQLRKKQREQTTIEHKDQKQFTQKQRQEEDNSKDQQYEKALSEQFRDSLNISNSKNELYISGFQKSLDLEKPMRFLQKTSWCLQKNQTVNQNITSSLIGDSDNYSNINMQKTKDMNLKNYFVVQQDKDETNQLKNLQSSQHNVEQISKKVNEKQINLNINPNNNDDMIITNDLTTSVQLQQATDIE